MTTGLFRTAQRRKAKLRLGLDGPSGSGKTFSALEIAYGLTHDWSKIAMIDTEHGSGDLYANKGPYAVLTFDPPFQVERYIRAIHAAEAEGFEVIIIDSLTHAWAGTGGLLDLHDATTQASNAKNSYTAWREVTPLHNELVDAILQSSAHVIATLRTKVDYIQDEDDNGRKRIRKVGTKPIQREGMDYEMTIVFDLSREHVATASKTRISEFDSWIGVPDAKIGEQLLAWLEQGSDGTPPVAAALPVETEPQAPPATNGKPTVISAEQVATIEAIVVEKKRTVSGVVASLNRHGVCPGGLETIPIAAYEDVVNNLRDLKPVAQAAPEPQEAPAAPAVAEAPATPQAATEPPQQAEAQAAVETAGLDPDDKAFLQGCDDDAKASQKANEPEKGGGTIAAKQLQRLGIICKHLEDNGIMWQPIMTSVIKRNVESRKDLSFEEGRAVILTLVSIEKTLPKEAVAS